MMLGQVLGPGGRLLQQRRRHQRPDLCRGGGAIQRGMAGCRGGALCARLRRWRGLQGGCESGTWVLDRAHILQGMDIAAAHMFAAPAGQGEAVQPTEWRTL